MSKYYFSTYNRRVHWFRRSFKHQRFNPNYRSPFVVRSNACDVLKFKFSVNRYLMHKWLSRFVWLILQISLKLHTNVRKKNNKILQIVNKIELIERIHNINTEFTGSALVRVQCIYSVHKPVKKITLFHVSMRNYQRHLCSPVGDKM